ncbi:Acetyltransferase, GNAT family [hydrothermal vent metagenome]|uniref:Acetyltransferase, GNAT family n=1 Tax=hydrothermal vent metagenome TaxID=652676 RepID=A0A3B0WSK1_9ZZZZ
MNFKWIYSDDKVNWPELSALYKIAPLGIKPADGLKIAFNHSMFKVFIYDSDKLIGVGRALADGSDCSYICDVAVLPNYQGLGLGKKIIQKMIALSEGHKKIILYAAQGKEGFYKNLGFEKMNTAMAIFSDNELAMQLGLINKT